MFVSVGSFWVTSSEPKCGIGANCKPTWTQNKIKIVLIQKQIKHHFRNRSSLGLPMLGKLWKSSNIFFVSTPVRLHVSSLREKHVRNFGGAPTCEVFVIRIIQKDCVGEFIAMFKVLRWLSGDSCADNKASVVRRDACHSLMGAPTSVNSPVHHTSLPSLYHHHVHHQQHYKQHKSWSP